MSEPQTVRGLSIREWAGERLQNSIRIAGLKIGRDREGWLEDVYYWRRICSALEPRSELSVPLSAIRALVQQWREAAQFEQDEMSNTQRAQALDQCADELAALCPAPPEDHK